MTAQPGGTAASRTAATVDVLARTLWAEARNEGRAGMEAVACVILNRAAHPRWWGDSIGAVCLKPYQFSCWNRTDPQYAAIRRVDSADASFRVALDIARRAVAGDLADSTSGADSYANLAVCNPGWAHGRAACCKLGRHTFFRVELPPPPAPPPKLPPPDLVIPPWPQGQPSTADLNTAELARVQKGNAA